MVKKRTCINCVMDTTDSKIVFDEKGVCDHCNTFYKEILPKWHTDDRGDKALKEIVKKIKKEGESKDFDCLMGMSGGIDSSYLLYIMVALSLIVFIPFLVQRTTIWETAWFALLYAPIIIGDLTKIPQI